MPQAVCTRYGLQVGAASAWLVRILMVLAAPIAWPIGHILDSVLGGEHTVGRGRCSLGGIDSCIRCWGGCLLS